MSTLPNLSLDGHVAQPSGARLRGTLLVARTSMSSSYSLHLLHRSDLRVTGESSVSLPCVSTVQMPNDLSGWIGLCHHHSQEPQFCFSDTKIDRPTTYLIAYIRPNQRILRMTTHRCSSEQCNSHRGTGFD